MLVLERLELARGIEPPTCGLQIARRPAPIQRINHLALQITANLLGLGQLFTIGWMIVQWPLIIVLMLVAVSVIYYFSPNVEQEWRWVIPGSLVAVVLWVVVSLAFKLYVENFGNYTVAYGSIGGGIVLLMWFYLSGIALLIGGELNAEIGKAAGKQA